MWIRSKNRKNFKFGKDTHRGLDLMRDWMEWHKKAENWDIYSFDMGYLKRFKIRGSALNNTGTVT